MDEAIKMEIRYQEHGIVGTKRCEETVFLFLDIKRELETIREYQQSFEKNIRKAINLFSRDRLWNIEITFYKCTSFYDEERYALVCREASDSENDVFTFYRYGTNQTDKQKVSKAMLLKTLIKIEKEAVEELISRWNPITLKGGEVAAN